MSESKNRLLYILKYLWEYTDEEHQVTTNQLIDILQQEYGISVHRSTLAKDLSELQDFGIDVVTVHSTQCKYFIGNRTFELPELKLLIDAVESSKFITAKKSDELIKKIHSLASKGEVSKLKRNNYVTGRIKPDNEQIYYIVDTINDAINQEKQIAFTYYEYDSSKRKVLKNGGEVYVISPYHLVWNNDFYYVVGYSEKKGKVVTFRVDRIATQPEILEQAALEAPKDFVLADFTKEVFSMYDGQEVEVELLCDNSLMKTMIDRFGEDVKTTSYNDTAFRLTTEVSASPTFFGWIFGFVGKVQILAPQEVKEQYKQMIIQASEKL